MGNKALTTDSFTASDRETGPRVPLNKAYAASAACSVQRCHGSCWSCADHGNIIVKIRHSNQVLTVSASASFTSVNAPNGQIRTQLPHPVQRPRSITSEAVRSRKASAGHTLMQVPQRSHVSFLTSVFIDMFQQLSGIVINWFCSFAHRFAKNCTT